MPSPVRIPSVFPFAARRPTSLRTSLPTARPCVPAPLWSPASTSPSPTSPCVMALLPCAPSVSFLRRARLSTCLSSRVPFIVQASMTFAPSRLLLPALCSSPLPLSPSLPSRQASTLAISPRTSRPPRSIPRPPRTQRPTPCSLRSCARTASRAISIPSLPRRRCWRP